MEPDRRRQVFSHDTVLQRHINADRFGDDFSSRELINGLSASLRRSSVQDGQQAFTPKPYIRLFEAAVGRLRDLRRDAEHVQEAAAGQVAAARKEHIRNLEHIKSDYDVSQARLWQAINRQNLFTTFDELESTCKSASRTVIQAGKRLADVDVRRQKALETKFLFQCYLDFCNGSNERLEELRLRETEASLKRCATTTRNLVGMAKLASSTRSERARAAIEKYSEFLEQYLLDQFEVQYRKPNLNKMALFSSILYEFDGASRVTAQFLNQQDFFILQDNVQADSGMSEELGQRLSDPDEDMRDVTFPITDLVDRIRKTLDDETPLIIKVFPNASEVLRAFIQRIFAQSVQLKLEASLTAARNTSTLCFLRVLHASYASLSGLVGELRISLDAQLSRSNFEPAAVLSILEQSLDDLFIPYLDDASYIELEKRNLQELFASFMFKFATYHSRLRTSKQPGMLNRVRQVGSKFSQITGSETEGGKARNLLRLAGIDRSNSRGKSEIAEGDAPNVDVSPSDGDVSIASAKRMLKWHAEAMGRAIELSPGNSMAIQALMDVLSEFLINGYIEVSLERCLEAITTNDGKSEPDLEFLKQLLPASTIMSYASVYAKTMGSFVSGDAMSSRREMLSRLSTLTARVERKINSILLKTQEESLSYTALCLSKQRKTDFRIREDDVSVNDICTQPCEKITVFMDHIAVAAKLALNGKNYDCFLTEIGINIHSQLMDHFKKFPVSQAGALILNKDIALYQSAASKWGQESLDFRFAVLREIGSLFAVPPQSLPAILRDDPLNKINRANLNQFLSRRDDYSSSNILKMLYGKEPALPPRRQSGHALPEHPSTMAMRPFMT